MTLKNNKEGLLSLAVIVASGMLLCYPLMFEGYLYASDAAMHLLRAQQFLKGFASGLLYTRWAGDANLGCGSPALMFYSPFIFFSYVLIGFFIDEVPLILNVSVITALVSSGLSMFLFSRLYLKRVGSLIISLAYMAVPYHLLDIYYRSAVGETWSFLWLPLNLYFAHRTLNSGVRYLAGLSISYAGLLITHIPSAICFSPFLLLYALFVLIRNFSYKKGLSFLIAIVLGFCLAAMYMLPAKFELQNVYLDEILSGDIYASNFLFSEEGAIEQETNRLVSRIGTGLILLPFISLCLLIVTRFRFKSDINRLSVFFIMTGAGSFFMTLSISSPIWEIVDAIRLTGYPWRFLVVTAFSASFCAGLIYENITFPDAISAPLRVVFMAVTAGVLIANAGLSYRILEDFRSFTFQRARSLPGWSIRANMSYDDMSMNYGQYHGSNYILYDGFFRPKWSVGRGKDNKDIVIPGILDEGNRKVAFLEGEGTIDIVRWEPQDREFHVEAPAKGRLVIRTFYYPTWKAYRNGTPVEVDYDPPSGLISLAVPSGAYEIKLRFERSFWGKLGVVVSLSAAVLLLGLYVWGRLRHRDATHEKVE